MASSAAPRFELDEADPARAEIMALGPAVRAVLLPLASLKLTVALFALSIFIVFAGTMAQTRYDIWYVVHNYFRTAIAWIEFQVFFPPSFFPNLPPIPGKFPFPGGWLIGAAMVVNLLAAHAVRFTYQAKGARLMTGMGVIAVGVLATGLVIAGGSSEGLQGVPFFEWKTLWSMCKLTLAALCAAGVWGALRLEPSRVLERRALFGLSAALGALVAWLFVEGDAVALGDSSMRILWQLVQATLAGVVLLIGCWLVFFKRAGIVLLHGGVGLMMLSELLVGTTAIEGQMHIREGDTVNYIQDIRSVELAFVDETDPKEDRVVVIPQSLLKNDAVISDEKLPFDLRVVKFMQNADVRMLKGGDKNPATAGLGREMFAEETAAGVGVASSKVDESAVYVELRKKGGAESLGTYLFSLLQSRLQDSRARSGMSAAEVRASTGPFLARVSEPTVVEVDGKPYHAALRFKRTPKPYSMKLVDVRTEYYPGTTTPRDYSSILRLTDTGRDVDRDVKVWMNNPLRFAGETFYQSTVGPDPITQAETTGLQVVTNSGWMIPYVSCMIVAVGMLFQFCQTLTRFLKRRETGVIAVDQAARASATRNISGSASGNAERGRNRSTDALDTSPPVPPKPGFLQRALPFGVVILCAAGVISHAVPPKPTPDGFDLYAAGKLPLLYEGRAKPLDTLARNTLQIISNGETFVGRMDAASLEKNWPTIARQVRMNWKALADEDLSKYPADSRPVEGLAKLIESKTKAPPKEIADFLYKVTSARQPALRWLLDVIAGREIALDHRVFRIDSLEVLDMLGLERRKGFLYSLDEILPRRDKFNDEVEKAHKKPVATLSVYERKLLEFDKRVRAFTVVDATFRRPDLPATPTDEIRERARASRRTLMDQMAAAEKRLIEQGHPPLIVPLGVDGGGSKKYEWKPFVSAWTRDYFEARVFEEHPSDPAVAGWDAIVTTYAKSDSDGFNRAVRRYQTLMADEAPPDLKTAKTNYEVYFNHFSPFYQAWILYIAAFVISVLAWLVSAWSGALRRTAFWLTLFILALHTFALGSRIYVSGRPPVTNLYSSAVFIGWGCVALGLILEFTFKLGIGNAISAIAGFATLFISFKLAGDGDTFIVMQAVLDTQFWLATHVTCITLGYATTFLSGLLGAFYVLRPLGAIFVGLLAWLFASLRGRTHGSLVDVCLAHVTAASNPESGKPLSRMIYGTLCFAIFFSFVGTVLGGLWADDSWGRFWGWDPKENGALMIVLWNALVLHARWGAMVKDRGLAVLAVGGNIITAWSWFGVNELGVGLHSYGFKEGMLLSLGLFALSQLGIIGIGAIQNAYYWWIQRAEVA